MRGAFADQGGLFSYISPEARVSPDHSLRKIRELVRDVLSEMNRDLGCITPLSESDNEANTRPIASPRTQTIDFLWASKRPLVCSPQ